MDIDSIRSLIQTRGVLWCNFLDALRPQLGDKLDSISQELRSSMDQIDEMLAVHAVSVNEMLAARDRAIQALRVELDKVKAELSEITCPLRLRQRASVVEQSALRYILPGCTQAPYYLRTYSGLCRFFEAYSESQGDAAAAQSKLRGIGGPNSVEIFMGTSAKFQSACVARLKAIQAQFPALEAQLDCAKSPGDLVAHRDSPSAELLAAYETDAAVTVALRDLAQIVGAG